uniref:Late embryogenesis abundant protein LEA-2 subgroup domain-containing protein n=1 Tax=Davidia involucrata TaxID=16924 RepID=A0A5B7BQ05_DAVIN
MAEKENHLATPTSYGRMDEEAQIKELRRKKRMKCLVYVVAFAVFQTAIITLFALTVMKVKTPKFRVRSATIENFDIPTTSNPSFNITMNAELGVKNTNFGHYKFDNSTITFLYMGTPVGSANILKARAKARSTKKFNVTVELRSGELGNDFNSGVLPLTSQSTLRGKVELMKVMKKKKSTNMNCTMEINISTRQLQNVKCN